MIDDADTRVDPREHAPADRYGETMLYDFAKFLTTLSLLVLGGMLTLSQAARDGELKLFNLVLITGSVAIAGTLAFTVAHALVDARARGREPKPWLPKMLTVAIALIGIGTGGFLKLWLETLA